MPAITVRGVTLLPPRDTAPTNFKILVPVMANDLSNAAAAGAAGDVVELRLDALSILDAPNVQNVLCAARAAIGQGVPLLATIRTKKEGGLADLTDAAYGELGTAICHSGLADLLDVEASTAPAVIAAIQQQARRYRRERRHRITGAPQFDTQAGVSHCSGAAAEGHHQPIMQPHVTGDAEILVVTGDLPVVEALLRRCRPCLRARQHRQKEEINDAKKHEPPDPR